MVNGHHGFFESAFASKGLMALFHSIETDLNLMDEEPFGYLFGNQRAIGEKNRSESMVSQNVIDLLKKRMKERFPSGEEEPQPLDLFKFF
jgi:hypothetical protein